IGTPPSWFQMNVAPTLTAGTYTLPDQTVNGNTINNLSQLSTFLNAGSCVINGPTIFEFKSLTTESFPVTFTLFKGAGSVLIRPSASAGSLPLVTAGDPGTGAALITLNGTQNISFSGKPGGTGSALNWKFQNTRTVSAVAQTFLIQNATGNGAAND